MTAFLQYTLQGLASGGFYALAALGLAVIFGIMGVVNFSHGAMFMLGAVLAAVLLDETGVPFGPALVVVPVMIFVVGVLVERLLVRWVLKLDPIYSFLLTYGVALVAVDLVKRRYGSSSLPYGIPQGLDGHLAVGGISLPVYNVFAATVSVVVCVAVWLLLTKTRIGMVVRAATEDSSLSRALGINVGLWTTPVFGFGIALAGFAGVLAAPFRAVTADMGTSFIIIIFAVVVIGGLGSILGAVLAGFLVGLVESYGQAYAPAFAHVLIFVLMAAVILVRPEGLLGSKD